MVNGVWEMFTYGLFALYKSDWVEVDGFDVMQYNTTWGGEDLDLLDRYIRIKIGTLSLFHISLSFLSLSLSLSLSKRKMVTFQMQERGG